MTTTPATATEDRFLANGSSLSVDDVDRLGDAIIEILKDVRPDDAIGICIAVIGKIATDTAAERKFDPNRLHIAFHAAISTLAEIHNDIFESND